MKKDSKVLIYVALSLIITGCLIMINTIVSVTKYDKDLYAEVYEEYDEQIKEITKTEFIDEEKIEPKETEEQYEVKAQISEDDNRTIGILKIQKLKLSYPVIKETTEENLKVAPTKYCGPEKPNTVGNLCITGHNYGTSSFFGKLDQLELGDMVVFIPKDGGTKVYEVYETEIVEPENTACLSQETNGNIEMTLITCAENSTKRLVVKCKVI